MDELCLIKRHFLTPGIYLRYILMYKIVPTYLLHLSKDFNIKIAQFLTLYLIYVYILHNIIYNTFIIYIYNIEPINYIYILDYISKD